MGFRLKVVAGPGVGSECPLEDAEVTIGRAPENGLVINDNNVSRVHAKVTLAPGNRVVVADAGSRNGVYVNDRKVNQQPLNPGDRVVIGQTVIELVSDAGGRSAARPAARPVAGAAPARRPNGGGADARTGNVVPVKNAVPVRTGANAKPMPRTAPVKKGGGKGTNLLLMGGVAGLLGVVVIATIVSMGGGNNGAHPGDRMAVSYTPTPARTPPLFGVAPGTVLAPENQIEKLPKDAQQWIDVGDSQRTSGNLVQARTSFRNALKIVPACESCKVRLDAVEKEIEDKISDREKAGILAFEAGDYKRAVDQWEIAISYIDDPKSSRASTLKQRVLDAKKQIATQPQ